MKKYFSIFIFLLILFFMLFLPFYSIGLLASFVAWDISLFTSVVLSGGLNRFLILLGLAFVGVGIAVIKEGEVKFK